MRALSPLTPHRTRREWVADGVLFAVSLWSWYYYAFLIHPSFVDGVSDWFWPVDQVLGFVACLLLWWTRRYPRTVGLLLVLPGALAITASLPTLIGVFRMAKWSRPLSSVAITALHIATALPYHWVFPLPDMPLIVWLVTIPLMYALVLCGGLLARSRRQVIEGLRESAARDRERYEERLTSTRRDERERIAREMHDVLAHRVSLLSVHAGALEYRTDPDRTATPPTTQEIHEAAVVIRENAHRAVEDLGELLTVLHEDEVSMRPQPRLRDIPQLVAEARLAGESVDIEMAVPRDGLRESMQRTAFRAVQEGLTNARKHAPHATVRVVVAEQDDDLLVEVENAVPVGLTSAEIPGGGRGLVGLAERVRLEGGRMDAAVRDGRFRLTVVLPSGAR
ncbi:two-component sensor histidine kinase [Cellulomonas xylanilytica]|uniref:histidine kinase n=1 Tax=Cellulomonas xylanilytica TaxID=233583 RepID=A0A510V955_9CELL|nr:two-component sensor histidine kinase [Cellulomonas xylanilytica]